MTELRDGCIVSWRSPKSLSLSKLRAALNSNGFDKDLAKDMAPRSAFARAAKQMDDDRIIRKVQEESDEIEFQFTKEYLAQGELKYDREFSLFLHKEKGTVRCENADMQQEAQRLVDHHIETREAGDVTRLVQKIFESKGGDLIPIREQGGAYFVPPAHQQVVSATKDLLQDIGGKLTVWTLSMGSTETKAAVSEATLSHMLSEVDEFRSTIENIDTDSKPAVVQRRIDRIALLRHKLASYGPLLMGLAAEVQSAIDSAEKSLNQKVTGDCDTEAEVVVAEAEVTSGFDGDIPLPEILPFDGVDVPVSGGMSLEDIAKVVAPSSPDLPPLPPPTSNLSLDDIQKIISQPPQLPPVPV